MKEKGFTLIELLAVIVILAIIALIATPIILNIINDAKEESNERSIELYASAAKNAIAKYQLNNTGAPTSFDQLEIEYDGDVVCTTQELYEDGSIYLAGCTVNGDSVDYTYGVKQEEPVEVGKLNSVCKPAETQKYATNPTDSGYKYNCKVDPNKEVYTFYVLNSTETSVNLIMDSNINISGEAIKSDDIQDKGYVAWVNKSDYTSEEIAGTETDWDVECDDCGNWNKGPITAMNYLQTATSNWTNLNPMIVSTFTDDPTNTYNMGKTYTTYARMPYYEEMSDMQQGTACEEKLYLIDYLSDSYPCEGRNEVTDAHGYWINSSYPLYKNAARSIESNSGFIAYTELKSENTYGVRPVITLEI